MAGLYRISAWRNLVHNDAWSRHTLQETIGQEPAIELLTAELATQTLATADEAFNDLGSLIGVLGVRGLSSDHLWIAHDEY